MIFFLSDLLVITDVGGDGYNNVVVLEVSHYSGKNSGNRGNATQHALSLEFILNSWKNTLTCSTRIMDHPDLFY